LINALCLFDVGKPLIRFVIQRLFFVCGNWIFRYDE